MPALPTTFHQRLLKRLRAGAAVASYHALSMAIAIAGSAAFFALCHWSEQ